MSARALLASAAIVAVATGAYYPLTRNEFVDYDDLGHIVADPVVTAPFDAETIRSAFSVSRAVAYWQPLTVVSLAADHAIFGSNPLGYHLENLFWHLATSLVVLALFYRATREFWRAVAVAALFATHPIAVESVGWAIERRAVLAGFLGLASFLAYSEWTRRRVPWRYLASLLLFAGSLLAKGLLLPGAAMLLAFNFWPLRRSDWKRSILEAIPFAAIGIAVGGAVLHTIGPDLPGEPPLSLRLENALVLPFRQLLHLAWPLDLGVYYPYPLQVPAWQWVLAGAGWLAISAGAFALRRRAPYLLFGWAWFVVALLPTLGLKQRGQWAALADRHAYLAALGAYAAAVWGVADLARRGHRFLAPALAGVALVALSALTVRQVGFWKDTVTLFARADEVADRPDEYVKYGLGKALVDEGRFEEGEAFLRQAIAIAPTHYEACYALGRAYLLDGKGRDAMAAEFLRSAIYLDPKHVGARATLGSALNRLGRYSDTVALLEDGPFVPEARFNLGVAYASLGQPDLASKQALALGDSPLGRALWEFIARQRR